MTTPTLPQLGSTPAPRRTAWEVQRAVLFALILREMKARVGGQWVGAVWTLIEPLTHVLIIVTILGFLRGVVVPGIEYPVFLVTGLLPYFLFQHLTLRLMDGIDANRGLFSYRQVKPLDTLMSRAVVEALMNLVVYIFTLGLLAWLGLHVIPAGLLEALAVSLLVAFLGTSVGVLAAVATHERPRIRSFVRMSMLPLYFASGVIFQVDLLPREYLDWLLMNPMLHLVELSRHAFIPAYVPPDGVGVLYPALFALAAATLALLTYRVERLRLVTST